MTQRILVTGGAGFIGSNFIDYLTAHLPEAAVHIFDKFTYAGNRSNLSERFNACGDTPHRLTKACMTDREKVTEAVIDADIIVHFACESHVTNSLAQADDFVLTNIYGTMVLCEEVIKYPVQKFILISSSEVYGSALAKPMDENHPLNPASPYAGSKAGQDRLAHSYFTSFGIPLIILRPFNQYGPRQHIEKVIPKFITHLLQGRKIHIEDNGVQTRDWLFVRDLCRAITAVIESDNADLFGQVINIGSGQETSVMTLATKIAALVGVDPADLFVTGRQRQGQVMAHISSMTKARELLHWQPEVGIDEGLALTVNWYRDNPGWWRSLKFPVLKISEMGK
jgi:dTDP-glucose 4,6-dehydratase